MQDRQNSWQSRSPTESLKSLENKKKHLKFLPAEKGNSTVVISTQRYLNKVNTKLKKDPITSVHDKLYRILLKLKKEGKLTPDNMKEMR